jgi:hypothetical protein
LPLAAVCPQRTFDLAYSPHKRYRLISGAIRRGRATAALRLK